MSPTYTSHTNIHTHTPQLHQPTPSLHLTHTLQRALTLDLSQHSLPHSAVQPHALTHSLLPSAHLQSQPVATLSHAHQPTLATQPTYPWLLDSSDMQPQRIHYVGLPNPMPGGHNVHLAYEPQDLFTLPPQHQVPPTSLTPARTLIEMHPPLPTPIIDCGRPICTPVAHTSSFTSSVTPIHIDVAPHTVSDSVYTPQCTAVTTAEPVVKYTAIVTQTESVCSKNAPINLVTPASVQLSTNTASTSTTTSQVATPTFPPVVVKPSMVHHLGKPIKNILKGFVQLMVGPHSRKKLRT